MIPMTRLWWQDEGNEEAETTQQQYKSASYQWKWCSATSRSSPPSRHVHFTRYSPVRSTLVSKPVNCGKRFAISPFVPTGLSNTNGEIVVQNIFNPGNHSFVDIAWVREVHMIDRDLNVNRFVWIEHIRCKRNLVADCLSPEWIMSQTMAPFLVWESWKTREKSRRHSKSNFQGFYTVVFDRWGTRLSIVKSFFMIDLF